MTCQSLIVAIVDGVSVAAAATIGVYVAFYTVHSIGLCFVDIADLVLLRLAWYVRFSLPTLAVLAWRYLEVAVCALLVHVLLW